ncbi:vacuolar protein sorting-associated protein 16 homolog isoform X4 [Pseudophryne corroboree]|uniref:vacuolar protein sorting-associated protein 16 homolog isoform X4 n=1 Tax=Pseudophryne corroboree TaxID=495146 RepID=UPI003082172C
MDFCTANWYPMGDVYYRKFDLYQMEWNIKEDFKDCLVAVGPYGGSIALMKNFLTKEKPSSSRPVLEIYSASGILFSTIQWKSGQVVHLGWTVSEDLLCIQEDGTVLIYDIFCVFKRCFSMGNEVKQNHILETKVFHSEYRTGVAILTGALKFTLTSNIEELKLRRMPEIPGPKVTPSCWTVLFQDRMTLILVAIGKDLYLLDDTICSVITLPGMSPLSGACLHMSVSFHNKYLAVFTDCGSIWMGTSSLKEKCCEFTSDVRQVPKQMAWCIRPRSKQFAVVVRWDKLMLIAGRGNESILFPLDEETFMVSELDGVRLISHSTHEFLHEIPKATEEIFKIASMAPGALLMEAQKEYEKESQKADDYLREIKDQNLLPVAVAKCIEASGYEHSSEIQKSLLKLLEYEPKSEDQVPLLLKMKRSNLALGKAIESGDTDLVYTVVSYMKHEFNRRDFFMTLQNHPIALSLYRQFCKHQEPETLKDLYTQDDNHQELGNFHVRSSYYTEKSVEGRVAELQNAVDEYYKAKNDLAAKVTEDQIKLLRIQRLIQEKMDKPYLDYSLHDTIYNLILDGMQKKAEQLYKEFKIPDKRYWWLKISALSEKEDWEELENFSKSKKSPIGYLPFVEMCMKYHNKFEAKKYTARVTPELRVKAFLFVGDLDQAAEAAIEHKNENEMNTVLSKCTSVTDAFVAEKIERAKAQLLKK